MGKISIEDFNAESATIKCQSGTDDVTLAFLGSIEMQDPGKILDPYFEKLHQLIVSNKIKVVKADFTALEYLNSSGIKCLINWLIRIPALSEDSKYKVSLLYNPEITWQETSLKVLGLLVPNWVEVTVK
jgi:hypothetical protein